MPLLSILYLTFPDTTAQQIGLYTAAGYAASLLLQIPGGMLADQIGHKRVLILSKLFLLISTICFAFGDTFFAFFHDTLTEMKQERSYRHISSRLKGDVSLLSVFFIIGLPFLSKIDIRLPFYCFLAVDFIGLLSAISFVSPKREYHVEGEERPSLRQLLSIHRGNGFYPIALFSALVMAFLVADNAFRAPYLMSLGYPIAWIGLVMGTSRIVWFLVGRSVPWLEKHVSTRILLFFEIFLFSGYYMATAFLSNPFVVGAIFSIIIGYMWGRNEIYNDLLLNSIHDVRYKSTMLSVREQIKSIVQTGATFGIGFVMAISYKLGFFVLGAILFPLLLITYFAMRKHLPDSRLKENVQV